MRRFAAAVSAAGLLVAACDSNGGGTGTTPPSTTSSTASKQALAPAALEDLLLSPPEVDSVLGVTGTRPDKLSDTLQEDQAAGLAAKGYNIPPECAYIFGPAVVAVYANTGTSGVHGVQIAVPSPESNGLTPHANQYVVSFSSAQQANDFFTTSSQRWPACANRQDTASGRDAGSPVIQWKVGPVSVVNGVLNTVVSVSITKDGETKSQSCQRALTVRNNVAIDVAGCRPDPGDVGVSIANQIAAKVDKQ